MSADSTECSFMIEEIHKDDPRLEEFLDFPDEGNQSAFVATIQLLPGSDKLEIEEMEGQLAWHHSKLLVDDFSALEGLGLRGKLIASGCTCVGDHPF